MSLTCPPENPTATTPSWFRVGRNLGCNEVALREDGSNGDNDLEDWDSDGDDMGEDDAL